MTLEPTPTAPETFADLGLRPELVQALQAVGYETPTPIQQQTIPLMLTGQDVIGQAQTGTGKTAAFALPILETLDLNYSAVQALILTPTRELAIQVSEALHTYAKQLGRVRIVPIYGGDSMQKQLTRLRGGVHVVVGTPGRVMDHLRRKTLELSALRTVVLDEADEMLRMGFLEDVEWILNQAGGDRQTALFSATMPREVRRIAENYLKNPASVEIKHKTLTVATVEQHYLPIKQRQKLEVLTQILDTEAQPGEAILIFARTKLGAADLAEHLEARGYSVEAMHGDMNQQQRESVIRRMREGTIEIVVATDVAARGLDVEHIGYVINYDIPNDPESYVHRIGRTARAGRTGKALLLMTPREDRMMHEIERYTGQKMTLAKAPTHADVAARRRSDLKKRILKTLAEEDLHPYMSLVEELATETEHDLVAIAAATTWLARGSKPLTGKTVPQQADSEPRVARHSDRAESRPERGERPERRERPAREERPARSDRSERFEFGQHSEVAERPTSDRPKRERSSRFESGPPIHLWVGAGLNAHVRPGDLVGAIANEAEIPGKEIGPIAIYDEYSVVGVPAEYVDQVLQVMAKSSIRGVAANMRLATARDSAGKAPRAKARNQGGAKPYSNKGGSEAYSKPAKAAPPKRYPTAKHLKKEKKKKHGKR
jgi:ATP-dependent RNA helicase DeaD